LALSLRRCRRQPAQHPTLDLPRHCGQHPAVRCSLFAVRSRRAGTLDALDREHHSGGILGAFVFLMAVSAAPVLAVAAGLLAGIALVAAAILKGPGRRTLFAVLFAATVPFAALTWWTIVTLLLTVVALAISVATTSHTAHATGARTGTVRPAAVPAA